MSHRNARLTPTGRRIMIERIAAGTPQAHVAEQMLVSRATVSKWWRRWLAEGGAGLEDRSSRPKTCPTRTSKRVEDRVCRLRRSKRWGPRMIAMHTGVPASTVHKILVRHGLNRLSWIDRPTGRVIDRYERDHPGELVHLDIGKVGRIPPGGGWWVAGPRPGPDQDPPGWLHVSALRGRRSQSSGLCRGPRQRESRHPGRVLVPGPGLVLGSWHGRR